MPTIALGSINLVNSDQWLITFTLGCQVNDVISCLVHCFLRYLSGSFGSWVHPVIWFTGSQVSEPVQSRRETAYGPVVQRCSRLMVFSRALRFQVNFRRQPWMYLTSRLRRGAECILHLWLILVHQFASVTGSCSSHVQVSSPLKFCAQS